MNRTDRIPPTSTNRIKPESRLYYCNDSACPDCGAAPELRICVACGAFGLVVDCGHEDRPRPLDVSMHTQGITCEGCERRLEGQAA